MSTSTAPGRPAELLSRARQASGRRPSAATTRSSTPQNLARSAVQGAAPPRRRAPSRSIRFNVDFGGRAEDRQAQYLAHRRRHRGRFQRRLALRGRRSITAISESTWRRQRSRSSPIRRQLRRRLPARASMRSATPSGHIVCRDQHRRVAGQRRAGLRADQPVRQRARRARRRSITSTRHSIAASMGRASIKLVAFVNGDSRHCSRCPAARSAS